MSGENRPQAVSKIKIATITTRRVVYSGLQYTITRTSVVSASCAAHTSNDRTRGARIQVLMKELRPASQSDPDLGTTTPASSTLRWCEITERDSMPVLNHSVKLRLLGQCPSGRQ